MAATNVKILFSSLDKLREIGRKISTTPATPTSTTKTATVTTRTTRTATVTSPTAAECKDNSKKKSVCKAWARAGRCRDKYIDYMRKNCRKTCSFCKSESTTVIRRQTKKPRVQANTFQLYCRDRSQLCSGWAREGRCHDGFKDYMNRTCPVTCSFCIHLNFT